MIKNNQKIPEGWSVVFLNSLSSKGIMNGIFNNPTKVGKGIPLINVVDLYSDKIDINHLSLLDVSEDELRRYETITGDLLFTRSSLKLEGIAQCNIVPTKNSKCVFDCHIMRIRPNDQLVIPYYLFAYCNTAIAKMQFMKLSKTTTMTTIDQDGLGQLKVLLPPLPEQEKIALVLETWDEAIEKLSGLIEQKKLLKKGLMQKLLTGKTRLPGFTQPWKEVKLGKICKLETATSKSAFIDENGKYYIIDMGAVSTEGTLISSKRTNTCEDLLKINDIVMPKDDIGGGNIIGKTAIIKQENTYVLSDHVFKLNIHDSDANFISYLINSYGYNKYMRRMSCGSAILGLSKKDVEKCLLYIPSDISEQQAIADVLSTADDEINLLNQKLETLKEQKKGLMQQLLTGQIRVKVN